jgi:cytochrome c oxidase subunit II
MSAQKRSFVRTGILVAACAGLLLGLADSQTLAASGQPSPWQLGLQQSASPVMDDVVWFHSFLLYIIAAIAAFVLVLLIIVMVKFNARANPMPSKTTHNTFIEVLWTVVPIVILAAIAVPSFRLLFLQQTIPPADLTVKAIGQQWFWQYEYPDSKVELTSIMLKEDERKAQKPTEPRLLAVDNDLVVPVNKVVRVLVTADPNGVIHAFAVPAFGVKIDAVPGRLNETWFKATREGMYYGQCSELCGKDHAYMPIAVRVVSEQDFAAWLDKAKKGAQLNDERATQIATKHE